jgi:microcompartment protein CcmK/EutM
MVYDDDLGAGVGDTTDFVEGREASRSFPQRSPIDAFDVAIVDDVGHTP